PYADAPAPVEAVAQHSPGADVLLDHAAGDRGAVRVRRAGPEGPAGRLRAVEPACDRPSALGPAGSDGRRLGPAGPCPPARDRDVGVDRVPGDARPGQPGAWVDAALAPDGLG